MKDYTPLSEGLWKKMTEELIRKWEILENNKNILP